MSKGLRGLSGRGGAHRGVLLLALFGGLLSTPSQGSAQVSVEELEVHFQAVASRGTLTQIVPIRNELTRPQQVRVVIGDWQRDSLGRNEFVAPGTLASSCTKQLKVFPSTFQVAAGGVEYVRVSIDSAPPAGCWSIVFFETVAPPQPRNDRSGSFLTIEVRTGVKVYVHAQGATKRGEIVLADVGRGYVPSPTAKGDSILSWKADFRFANRGTDHLRAKPSVEVRDASGKLLHTIKGEEVYLTPGALRDIMIALPALASGDYVALLLVDFGGDEITAAQLEFKVP